MKTVQFRRTINRVITVLIWMTLALGLTLVLCDIAVSSGRGSQGSQGQGLGGEESGSPTGVQRPSSVDNLGEYNDLEAHGYGYERHYHPNYPPDYLYYTEQQKTVYACVTLAVILIALAILLL